MRRVRFPDKVASNELDILRYFANLLNIMTPTGPSLLSIARRQRGVLLALLAVVALAGVNWVLRPDQAAKWLRAMLLPTLFWLGVTAWHLSMLKSLRRRGVEAEPAVTRYFGSVMGLVFATIAVPLFVRTGLEVWLVTGHGPDPDVARRIVGVAVSLVFIGVGNALPKILTPLSLLSLDRAELVTSARRFVGTAFVVLGLAMLVAFVGAPFGVAASFLRWAVVAGLVMLFGAIVWMNVRATRLEG